MRYAINLTLRIFILGIIILFVALFAVYRSNYNNTINNEFQHTTSVVDAISMNLEKLLLEKIKTTQTLSITPILKEALEASNRSYSKLSEIRKNEKIHLQNERWKTIKNENDAFILEFTDNSAALFLKEQQNNIEGEYGEIFLTNKYGALVASTAKLTTFAHGHKYWWQGAFNNGEGAVFLDDRGYDDSVRGYVLGLVIPIKQGDEIIGILKVNLNILGTISKWILSSQQEDFEDFKLVRSGGEIIFEEGSEPLKNRIPDVLSEKLQLGDNQPFLFEDSENKWLIGMSEIGITSGMKGFCFGGTFESIDHKKGNTGESWYLINYRKMTTVLQPLKSFTLITFFIGVLLTIFLAFAALLLGNRTAKPLMQLIEQSKKIAKGESDSRVIISRKDEIGYLGNAFNTMAEELEKTTTSIVNLESEISERKQAEEELKKAKEAAETAQRVAEAANRAKSAFLANMSHEVRTPLNSVLGFADILEGELHNGRHEHYVSLIKTSGRALLGLLDDIFELSKLEAEELKSEYTPVNLRAVVESVAEIFSLEVAEKGLEFTLDIDPDFPEHLLLDEIRLRQILLNLIGNAVKFTNRGSVALKVSDVSDMSDQSDMVNLQFQVSDTGIGIPEDQREKIFGAFEQQPGHDHAKYGGTGLGLALTKRLVNMMGGTISVTGEVDRGSTFTVTIKNARKTEAFKPAKKDIAVDTRSLNVDETALSVSEAPERLPELIQLLETTYMPQCKEIDELLIIDEVREFAVNLNRIAREFHFSALETYSHQLQTHVQQYDVSGIKQLIAEFPKLVEKVKEWSDGVTE